MTPLQHLRRRHYSSQQAPSKVTSPHIGFYQSFGRPIAKVFLGAVFTYQVAYWVWVKLETDEMKEKKNDEINDLKAQLKAVKGS
ncbi:hypothetical protein G7Y79_00011g029690 [Physcia stellaris]|nr:hypothetical protein G7Y79_00011g029690 [Physcia stellaris]